MRTLFPEHFRPIEAANNIKASAHHQFKRKVLLYQTWVNNVLKTQACSTVLPAVPITIKFISPIVRNFVRNDPPLWGSLSSADLHQIVNAVYDEIVYWRKNLFMLLSGSAGKEYVSEATRLINIWSANATDVHSVSLKLLMIMPALLLQKNRFKSKQNSEGLKRRFSLWKDDNFDSLVREARTNNLSSRNRECRAHQITYLRSRLHEESWPGSALPQALSYFRQVFTYKILVLSSNSQISNPPF